MNNNKEKADKSWLEIAKFTKTQGLKGELRAQLYCDSPEIIQEYADRLFIGEPKRLVEVRLTSVRKGFAVMKIAGIDDIGNAEVFIGESLYVDKAEYTLPENTWFIADLIGLKVIDADSGVEYGVVDNILQNAPKDVYVVRAKSGRQLLFPSIPEVLIDTDIDNGIIKIRPLEGLFDV
ncbi:MAG: ribosome maturation factor RimM [Oscillospiraceae bacterium]|nr:ribosome maturation factor RimM [Oscillospiraceae bacterium]